MRVALYARVSTNDQSCELQLTELRELAKHRSWEVTDEYVDTGWSGKLESRPQLNRLMQDARQRRFDLVAVWHILGAVAQFERELIRERVTTGIAEAKRSGTRSGKAIGRPRVIVDKTKLRQWQAAGWSLRDIAGRTGIAHSTVRRLLCQNPPAGPPPNVLQTHTG